MILAATATSTTTTATTTLYFFSVQATRGNGEAYVRPGHVFSTS